MNISVYNIFIYFVMVFLQCIIGTIQYKPVRAFNFYSKDKTLGV